MHIVRFAEADVPSALRAQALALQEQAWPGEPGEADDSAHDPALRPRCLLLVDGDGADATVLASLDVLTKEIEHAGERWTASGLSRVVTDRARQRAGHGRALVSAALADLRADGVDLGLFTCDRPLRAFYASAGWQELPGTVLVGGTPEAPFPSDQWDKVTMGAFLTPRARAASAHFEHARIGLYPGPVDKLW
ncbi:GNAT family N-acetyltransferase [Streptacidiphilus jiangxiensis]|uniref:Predicted N-acyltransferase, GNAT family n=1 Tax=Streptacidiphilus jiangxiensis TaxID=235985 RepID=A0A1H7M0N7_STRJI|nr:GNAT family N-acetyltransferase [Streptacidiphilus jiangxiensis]SEL04558.1 Predicted N-acyltransferase, GNAT family [Streptacidiphilus jiangxiensis]